MTNLNLNLPTLNELDEVYRCINDNKKIKSLKINFNDSINEFIITKYCDNLITKLDIFLNNIDISKIDKTYLDSLNKMINEFNILISNSLKGCK